MHWICIKQRLKEWDIEELQNDTKHCVIECGDKRKPACILKQMDNYTPFVDLIHMYIQS